MTTEPRTKESGRGGPVLNSRYKDIAAELERVVAERDALREALKRIEPLIDAQFAGHADVAEFMEKVRKLNEALDVVRAVLDRPE